MGPEMNDMMPDLSGVSRTLKLVAIAAIAAGAFYAAWSWRGSIAEEAQRKAVDGAVTQLVNDISLKLDTEREGRIEFQKKMSDGLEGLSVRLDRVRSTTAVVASDIAADRAKYRDFYKQPLPDTGRKAWIQARELSSDTPQSSSSPSSAPSSSSAAPAQGG